MPAIYWIQTFVVGFPETSLHLEFKVQSESPLLEGVPDFQLHLAIDHALDADTSQILDDPVGTGFLELRKRVGRRERNDFEPGRLTSPDARRRILQNYQRRGMLQTQARPTKQIAPGVRLAQLNIFRHHQDLGVSEVQHAQPAVHQRTRSRGYHAPASAGVVQR